MPNQSVKLTKTVVESTPAPTKGTTFLRDTELKGFGLWITTKGVRTYFVEKRFDGRNRRIKLGKHGELTPAMARKKAHDALGQFAMGKDPTAERQRQQRLGTTLRACFRDFKRIRRNLSEKTLYDYDRILRRPLKDWQDKPIGQITPIMVKQRFQRVTNQHSESYANLTMRVLRSLINFAIANYDDGTGEPLLVTNPVNILTRTKAWQKPKRRQTVIKLHELSAWYEAVEALRDPSDPASFGDTVADFLLVMLFTGMRRGEAATLQWKHVDLKDGTIRLEDTKNGETITLPLSDFLLDLLNRRHTTITSTFVFPGRYGRHGLIEPKKQIARVVETSGVEFTCHDLRRTFSTIADSLEISPYALKRLLNHKMPRDVTAGYIVSDVDRLRYPTQRIADFICVAFAGGVDDYASFHRVLDSFQSHGKNDRLWSKDRN